jgi:hypothetical protein
MELDPDRMRRAYGTDELPAAWPAVRKHLISAVERALVHSLGRLTRPEDNPEDNQKRGGCPHGIRCARSASPPDGTETRGNPCRSCVLPPVGDLWSGSLAICPR